MYILYTFIYLLKTINEYIRIRKIYNNFVCVYIYINTMYMYTTIPGLRSQASCLSAEAPIQLSSATSP